MQVAWCLRASSCSRVSEVEDMPAGPSVGPHNSASEIWCWPITVLGVPEGSINVACHLTTNTGEVVKNDVKGRPLLLLLLSENIEAYFF